MATKQYLLVSLENTPISLLPSNCTRNAMIVARFGCALNGSAELKRAVKAEKVEAKGKT